jgi:THO complex subunit 2
MAPGGSGKRKRGDRTWSGDSIDRQRPSPHRPENLNLAQQSQGQYSQGYGRDQDNSRGRGGRRPSRGGRGGSALRSPTGPSRNGANQLKSPTALQPISPPINQSRRDQKDVPKANVQPLPGPTTSIAPEAPPAAKPKPQPYYYEYLSDTRIQGWESMGKREVVEKGTEARSEQDYTTLSCLFQELVRSGLDGRIPFEETGATIREIIGDEIPVGAPADTEQTAFTPSPFDARTVFLDTLSILTDSDNENPDLRPIVLSTGISATLMRQTLETPLLQSLGLIRDTFARMGIRKQTNLLYRQSNYNLLREESEGYSKLLTELFTTSNNGAFSSSVVEDTFERVKAMVGAFDMDVGRVLDVTLDVFAAVVVRQNKFFVKLLRTSSWWPKDDEIGKTLSHQFQGGLPKWALPDASSNAATDQDKEETARSNDERDRLFWTRVREVGIKAYFELGRRLAPDSNLANSLSDLNDPPGADFDEDQRWIRETGTLPPRGNRVAAQLLGFKLRFYSSPTREPSDTLPENLIWLTALLIKIGFVSLRDLYPHLWPTDDAMEALREKKMAERAKAERDRRQGAGSQNALAMAGALADDTLTGPPLSRAREVDAKPGTPAKTEESDKTAPDTVEEKDVLPEAKDQKVQLLKSLLAIGALPESLYILARFPWLLDAYPELPSFICRILHQSLSKVYSVVEPPPIFGSNDQAPAPDVDQSGIPKGHIRLGQYPARRVLKWAELDAQESPSDANSYRFYWEEWADNIPCCQSVDDVFLLCGSFLNLLGVKIGLDAPLVTKIARIGKDSLQKDHSESNRSRWLDLCKRLLVPALSLTSREPGVVNEVWEILKQYPRDTRYSVYAEWYQGQISRLPDIKAAFDRTQAETKDALKRISKTNTKHMARVLAKVAYSSPGIVINAAIAQIEAYDNLIQVVIACARYFSALGYDVMTWCLLTALGQKGRNRVQADGMLTSKWLLALATFTGKIFKQYERTDCSPVLQYVAEQLRQNNSTDLVVLENLTSTMGGIVSDASFNDAQIQAMGGGNLLQLQTMLQLHDKRNDTKGGSRRLMRALTDTQLAGQLLISISQERKTCIFRVAEEDAHLKLLGNLLDEIHRTLTQYLDLLRHSLTVEEFDKLVPDTSTLIGDFGVEPEIAFWINRESIAWAMAEADKAAQELNERRKSEALAVQHTKDVNGDVAMADGQPTASETKMEATPGGGQNVVQAEDAANGEPGEELKMDATTSDPPALSPLPPVDGNGDSTPWHAVLQDQMDKLSHVLSKEAIANLGLPFYVTFWQLSLFDLHIPGKAYEDEIARQKKNAIAIGNDRSDPSSTGAKRRETLKKDAVNLADQLLAENKSHLKLYTQTRARLQKEKELWFAGMRGKYELLSIALLEQCFLPRIFLSPVDSFYCFKMFKYLHSSGTPNFRTMVFLDQLFKEHRLTSIIFLCTSKEAENLGRFLSDVLRDLNRWHADKALYEKEAYGPKKDLPGFARSAPDAEGKLSNFLDFEDFRRLLYRWHQQVGNAFKNCFTGEEYMHIRNAIVMLKAVHQVFPAINWMGHAQVGLVTKLSESESREDLKIAATSLLGNLRRREKQWILPQAFRIVSQAAKQTSEGRANPIKSESTVNGANGVRSTPSTPIPPKAQPIAQKTLNATALDFKPSATQ